MEEDYVQPGQFLFGVVISVLLSILFNAASRTGQTEGRQTMFGIPKDDVERLMSHYGITEDEACELLGMYSVEDLLPPRGYGQPPAPVTWQIEGRQTMIHPHGEHDCYCPSCGSVITVEEDVQCAGINCPDCGMRMRAVDIGERRLVSKAFVPQEIFGYSQGELATGLTLMEDSMEMGDKARLTFCTEALPSEDNLEAMYLGMLGIGCHLSRPTARMVGGIPTTEFVLKKGSPQWEMIIPLIIPLLIIGLITFGIFRLESISKALMPIILIGGGLMIVLAVLARKPATAYIERGGKVPYLPATNGGPSELEEKAHSLWVKACEAEGIPVESKFVVFSDDNPYIKDYNEAVGRLQRLRQFKGGRWQPAVIKSKKALAAR